MANRPKGSVLRTSVIQDKLSTVVYEILEETLKTKGYVESTE